MKKCITLAITLLLVTSVFSSSVFAYEENSSHISDETIISRDNIYQVAEYLGLGEDAIVPYQSKSSQNIKVSVAELKRMQKLAVRDDTSEIVVANYQNPTNTMKSTSGTKTVYSSSQIGSSIGITYSVTGTFFTNNYIKYWIDATGSSISADPTYAPYFHAIDEIHEQIVTVENAYSSNSNIRFEYNYDVGSYLGVEGFAIRYYQVNIDGFTNFYGSMYL